MTRACVGHCRVWIYWKHKQDCTEKSTLCSQISYRAQGVIALRVPGVVQGRKCKAEEHLLFPARRGKEQRRKVQQREGKTGATCIQHWKIAVPRHFSPLNCRLSILGFSGPGRCCSKLVSSSLPKLVPLPVFPSSPVQDVSRRPGCWALHPSHQGLFPLLLCTPVTRDSSFPCTSSQLSTPPRPEPAAVSAS